MSNNPTAYFSPGQPISKQELLVGRTKEIRKIDQELSYQGARSIVITGARGIGKTSLAKIAVDQSSNLIETQCHVESTFSNWASNLLGQLGSNTAIKEKITETTIEAGLGAKFLASVSTKGAQKKTQKEKGIDEIQLNPDVLYRILLGLDKKYGIVIDEFDRISTKNESEIALFGDFIKLLSNKAGQHSLGVVFIGVGANALSLFRSHPSIKRNVVPIHLNRLTQKAVGEFFNYINNNSSISFNRNVIESFKKDFKGFPHFVHLVGKQCVLDASGTTIELHDYESAIDSVLTDILGLDTIWDFIRNKCSAEGDAILKELLNTRNFKITFESLFQTLAQYNYKQANINSAIKQLCSRRILISRNNELKLSDPEMSPFLFCNYRTQKYISSTQAEFDI